MPDQFGEQSKRGGMREVNRACGLKLAKRKAFAAGLRTSWFLGAALQTPLPGALDRSLVRVWAVYPLVDELTSAVKALDLQRKSP